MREDTVLAHCVMQLSHRQDGTFQLIVSNLGDNLLEPEQWNVTRKI